MISDVPKVNSFGTFFLPYFDQFNQSFKIKKIIITKNIAENQYIRNTITIFRDFRSGN